MLNRSFRSSESQLQRKGRTLGSVMKEKDDDLALFLEVRKHEKERNNLLLNNSDDLEPLLGSKPGSSPIFKITSSTTTRKGGPDDFLNADSDKNDYDWLLTPPGTPLFPSLERESHESRVNPSGISTARPTALRSRLSNPQTETAPKAVRGNLISRQPAPTSALNTSFNGLVKPSSASSTRSRASTPSGRPTLPAPSTKASRPSTPTSRPTLTSSKPTVTTSARPSAPSSARPSTPSSARPSTPTARPTFPASKPSSRATTPTRRPSTPSLSNNSRSPSLSNNSRSPSLSNNSAPPSRSPSFTSNSAPPSRSPSLTNNSATPSRSPSLSSNSGPPSRSSPLTKPITSRTQVPARGVSPTVKSRPWKPAEMPGFSLDAPPNLRTTMPERPLSASRGRPGAPSSSRSSSVEPGSNGRPRRQSCSPTPGLRGRSANGSIHGNGVLNKGYSNGNSDSVNPGLIGTKMVERVINSRRLAPPSRDEQASLKHGQSKVQVKASGSPDSGGFGRNLSKKSLDMALRHMDIRRSIPSGLRPLITNIPASSMYSVRSGSTRSRPVSVSDSPLATSSNASSEQSVNNNNILCIDGNEMEEDSRSERGSLSSPATYVESICMRSSTGSGSWLHSPEIKEDTQVG
ncbi:hypothetical protein AMTRI_Chr08g159610 [Amborella trichopoda]